MTQCSTDPEVELSLELTQRELARRHLIHFVERMTEEYIPGWHLDEICLECESIVRQVISGTGTAARTILEAPPRHGKSQIVSRCLPVWMLGRYPNKEIIVATYGQDLADDFGSWARDVLTRPDFKVLFPGCKLKVGGKAVNDLQTTAGGGIRFVGRGGPITGRGGHLCIVDDPIKNAIEADSPAVIKELWDWYTSTLRTRLAPGGGIIVMHTRWRVNDLAGRLQAAVPSGGEPFRTVTFKMEAQENDPWGRKPGEALHPERYSQEDMLALKRALLTTNPRDWFSLYQQEPMIEGGNIFKVEDFVLYKPGDAPKTLYWYLACDLAVSTRTSADHTVLWPFGIDCHGGLWFSPDFVHARLDSPETIEEIVRLAILFNARGIVMEGGVIHRALRTSIEKAMRRKRRYFEIFAPAPVHDKVTRSQPLQAGMRAEMVHFPDTERVRHVVIPEFLHFTGKPSGDDDLVDAPAWAAIKAPDLLMPSIEEDQEDAPEAALVPWSQAWIERSADLGLEDETVSKNPYAIPRRDGKRRKRVSRWEHC